MKLVVPKAFNGHVHLRQRPLMDQIIEFTMSWCQGGIAITNTKPPVRDAKSFEEYQQELDQARVGILNVRPGPRYDCSFFPTLMLCQDTTPEMIDEAYEVGCRFVKLIPQGASTGSEFGVRLLWKDDLLEGYLRFNLQRMEQHNMVLMVHGELPANCQLDDRQREVEFLPLFEAIHRGFPKLRMVLEHISTIEAVKFMERLHKESTKVAATITPQHLALTWADVFTNVLNVHNLCRPPVKNQIDRSALKRAAAFAVWAMSGTDTAPHTVVSKHSGLVPSGVFSEPVALSVIAESLEDVGGLENLPHFLLRRAKDFYEVGEQLPGGTVTISKEEWTVEQRYGGIIPLFAGKTLGWKVLE